MESADEDAVFEKVRDLARAGEYLDDIPGVLQPEADRPGCYQYELTPDNLCRPIYYRGSDHYLAAKREGLVGPLPPLTTASAAAVAEAEAQTGFPFPPLLRRLYLEVGDGGFGPGAGLYGISSVRIAGEGWSFLPSGVVLICEWGCAISSLIDCSSPEGPMWGFDPNPGPQGRDALFPEGLTFAAWLDRWLNGTLRQPWIVQDSDTGQWRGATDAEHAAA